MALRPFLFLVTLYVSASSIASARVEVPSPVAVEELPTGTMTRPVQLSKVIVKLSRGEAYGRIKGGLICAVGEPLIWKGGRVQVDPTDFDDVFKDELGKLGFDVVSGTGDLFDEGNDKRAEYLVGSTIKSMTVEACFPNSGFGDMTSAKGTAVMEVEWQVYNRLDRQVVERFTTRTGYSQKKSQAGGLETILFSAFAENVRALAASGKLQKILVGQPVRLDEARKPDASIAPMPLALPKVGVSELPQAVQATLLVQSGGGHGSGILISSEGYVLTNYHVVGEAAYLKLRWSDGSEALGEVVRKDKGRDIALIKTSPTNRLPFKLGEAQLPVGTNVYAIGAPLDRKLQSTVTRGIVSARRVVDGYSYIQSDASVVPGNSGGPLIDAKGNLIGVTVSGIRINDAPQGVNFFIPASEAFAFLGIVGR